MNIPKLKKVFVNEKVIAVGGMIGLGKSTLVASLQKKLDAIAIFELNDNDELQKAMLKSLYEGKRKQTPSVFQVDFLLTRSLNYREALTNNLNNKIKIFDRTIFEDLLFAHQNMANQPHRYRYYQKLWEDEVKAMIYSLGIPNKYIILDATWDVFKKRIFARGRDVEIQNFEQNENYFYSLMKLYKTFMVSILEEYGINYCVIDASSSKEDVLDKALDFLNKS